MELCAAVLLVTTVKQTRKEEKSDSVKEGRFGGFIPIDQLQVTYSEGSDRIGTNNLLQGDSVLIKDFRHKGTWRPGTIAEGTSPQSYVVVLRDCRVWKRHIDQMRKGDNSLEDNVIVENSEGENTEVNKPMVNSPTYSTTVQLGVHKPDNPSQLKHHQQTSLPRRVRWEDKFNSNQSGSKDEVIVCKVSFRTNVLFASYAPGQKCQ
ncbi:hypothetical protein LOTGIDRAFT_161019 [Lottia gigantea]|uniref:Uncharacterized protein n=1 Tax=Lottia gigantea TaxID=225164 RepID=V4AHU1_LOTGI|nr:hypothetical protein LOTGIDRAFT_161019 [Lottia gigantea]ESO94770.1 hypothetical protein LOTGIDRAFT_161019 [Lottia gigantea]